MTATESPGSAFGANSWLVEEMYEQYRSDPGSVSETWQEFFSDYKPSVAAPAAPAPVPAQAAAAAPTAAPAPTGPSTGGPARADGVRIVGFFRSKVS